MGLTILVLGLVAFLGAHVFVTMRAARAAVIARLGELPYKGLMSLVSLIGIILIAMASGSIVRPAGSTSGARRRGPTTSRRSLMWPASICVVAAYSRGDIWRDAQASDAGRGEDLGAWRI